MRSDIWLARKREKAYRRFEQVHAQLFPRPVAIAPNKAETAASHEESPVKQITELPVGDAPAPNALDKVARPPVTESSFEKRLAKHCSSIDASIASIKAGLERIASNWGVDLTSAPADRALRKRASSMTISEFGEAIDEMQKKLEAIARTQEAHNARAERQQRLFGTYH